MEIRCNTARKKPLSRGAACGLLIALELSACSASSGDIRSQFVAPDQYQELSCQQIGAEGERVARRVAEISGVEYARGAGAASWLSAQPIVVRWPTAWLAASEEGTAELSKLKGEFEALERASGSRRCSLNFKQQAS